MRILFTALLSMVTVGSALAGEASPADVQMLKQAEDVIKMSVSAPDKGIPKDLLQRTECVGVFPNLKKAAFVVGGEAGKGVFTCRKEDGSMGPPAFFTVGGASVGWQFGGQEADVLLLIMNKKGIEYLLKDKVTLGGEVSAAAGPIGRTAEAVTDLQLHAQILSWSRSKGVFLGAALQGSVIKTDMDAMKRFYGKPLSAKQILLEGKTPVHPDAQAFVNTTTEVTHHL